MVEDSEAKSYNLDALNITGFNIGLIDGPPIVIGGALSRLTPLLWCVRNMKSTGSTFLDDSDRPYEGACLERLLEESPNLSVSKLPAEKGLVEIKYA